MRRGIGRLRAGGAGGFSPSQIAFTTGLWLDQSDISTGLQDSAGTTPQTATGQPTGKRLDKSGNSNHVIQATTTSRPIWTVASNISGDVFDGVDDGYANATATFGASMELFVAIQRTSTAQGIVLSDAAGTKLVGAFQSASSNAAVQGSGSNATVWANGVQLTGGTAVTQGTLDTALPNGSWVVLEVRALDLSTWTGARISLFTGFILAANVAGAIICPTQTTAARNQIRTWLGAKVGLSL